MIGSDEERSFGGSEFAVSAWFTARMAEKGGKDHNEITASVDLQKKGAMRLTLLDGQLYYTIGEEGNKIKIAAEEGVSPKEIGEWFIKQHEKQREYQRLCAEFERECEPKVESGKMTFEEFEEGYPEPSDVWSDEA